MQRVEKAVELFGKGYNCSQAILGAFSTSLGLPKQLAFKIAAPYGAGLARRGGTCGAVTGAIMVLGLAVAKSDAMDSSDRNRIYGIAEKFMQEFIKENKSVCCRDLLGYDISNPEERKLIQGKGLDQMKCNAYVRNAAEILLAFLEDSSTWEEGISNNALIP